MIKRKTSEENHSMLEKIINSHLKIKDVSIEYTDSIRIIALFEKTDMEVENFERDLNSQSAYLSFEHI